MKIGIMGGTFNPIHHGHMSLAKAAKEQYLLDKVWFMPSGLPAHKSNSELTDAMHRLNMVRLALEGLKGYEASDYEIKKSGFTYTAETLTGLKKEYPEDTFYFMIGGDSLMKFLQWKNPESILTNCIILATGRGGYSEEAVKNQIQLLKKDYHADIHYVEMENMMVSSREIREACRKKNYDKIKNYLPKQVLSYIKENRLYEI